MIRDRQELLDALVETRKLPHGRPRITAIEQVTAEIEAADERALLPYAYHSLVWAYHRGSELEKAPVPFNRQLELYDTEPEIFDEEDTHRLLWSFKWMTAGRWKLPTVSREQIEQTIEDMERRYAVAGLGMSAVHDVRLYYAIHRGDWSEADARYERTIVTPRDALSDCAACTAHARGDYKALRGRDAEAALLLDSVIERGLSCATEPHAAFGTALQVYLRQGRLDDARAAHLTGYRLVRGQIEFQDTVGDHLQFLARTGNEARGLEVLTEHHAFLTRHDHPLAGLGFLASAGLLLRRLAETAGADTPVIGPEGATCAGDLALWARAEALALAGAFDRRNGTGWHTERTLAVLDAAPLVRALRFGLAAVRFGGLDVMERAPAAGATASEAAAVAVAATPAAAAPVVGPVAERREQVTPIGVTAELIGAEGLDLAALAARAADLTAIGHPAAAELWNRVAVLAGPDADLRLRAAIDDGIGRHLAGTDPFAGHERLRRAVERWTAIGDERALAIARSRAAVAAALVGDHDEAVAESAAAGAVIERLGGPSEQLHHVHRLAYIRLATAVDDAGRAEAAELFRQHTAAADALGEEADAVQSRIILLDRLEEPADPEGAAVAWQECADAARAAGREWWLPHIAVRLAQARLGAGWFPDRAEEVLAPLGDAVRCGDEWGDTRPAAYATFLHGQLLAELERYAEAHTYAFDAVVRAEDAAMGPLVAEARALLGSIYFELERDHEAVQFLEAALPALSRADHVLQYRLRYRLGVSLRRVGEAMNAATHLAEASRIAEEAGALGSAAHASNLVAVALEELDPVGAAAAYARAGELFAAVDEERSAVRMYRAQAGALADAEQFDEALTVLAGAGAMAETLAPRIDVNPAWERAEVDDQSARVLALAGRGVEAVQRALSAEQRHLDVGSHSDAAYAAALAAQVTLDLLEDPEAAEPVARRAVSHAEACDDVSARASAALALADVLDAQGRTAEAARLRASAGADGEP